MLCVFLDFRMWEALCKLLHIPPLQLAALLITDIVHVSSGLSQEMSCWLEAEDHLSRTRGTQKS